MDIEKFKSLESYFFRAPSAHNTQPWLLRYESHRVKLYFDPARTLPASDPTRRDLFLSLGAFVETVLIVCANSDMAVDFQLCIEIEKHFVGEFVDSRKIYSTKYTLEDIQKRQTSRLKYEIGHLSPMLKEIQSALPDNIQFYTRKSTELYEVYRLSDRKMYEDNQVAAELYQWLRLDRKDARYKKDGLNADALALSSLEAKFLNFVLRPARLKFLRHTPILSLILHFSAAILKDDSCVIALSSRYKSFEELLMLGRSLQGLWLNLAQAGYYTHPLSQIIDNDESYQLLANQLKLQNGEKIYSIFRVGQSSIPAYSPRRNI